MNVNFFTNHPFSVEYKSKSFALNKNEVSKIILATVLGSLLFLVGGIFAFYGSSYYFRSKKVEQLSKESNPEVAKIDQFKNRVLSSVRSSENTVDLPAAPQSLRIEFDKTMERTMGEHLTQLQKQTLSSLFDEAMQTAQPRITLEKLIRGKINRLGGWGEEKANHILRNLLTVIPESAGQQLLSQVRAIAGKYINDIGTKLVCFYKSGPTEFLGNFALCPQKLKVWGKTFECSEAAFQWGKYYLAAIENNRQDLLNDPLMNQFFTCNGEDAFKKNRSLAEKYPNVLHSQWSTGMRDRVMWEVLNAKFQQNPHFAQLLQETKGAYLLEHNEKNRDNYWSDNSDGTGKNMLGKMLMAIRDGKPCPPIDHSADEQQVKAYALYANRPDVLGYNIFLCTEQKIS